MVHRRRRRGFWSFASCLALLELLKALGFSGRLFIVSSRFRFLGVLSPELSGINSGDKLPPMINL